MRGRITGDMPCPQCRSNGGDSTGNHLIIFDSATGYCNKCGYKTNSIEGTDSMDKQRQTKPRSMRWVSDNTTFVDLADRLLSAGELENYGIRCELSEHDGTTPVRVYYPSHCKGQLQGYKIKDIESGKWCTSIGKVKKADLFGQHLYSKRKLVLVTEGELDAVSAYKMLCTAGKDYVVVSVPNGAGSQLSLYSQEWLSAFETIILCFDNDKPGQDGATKLATLFKAGQCKNLRLPAPDQDVNEYLTTTGQDYTSKRFLSMIWDASAVGSGDMIQSTELSKSVIKYVKEQKGTRVPLPWPLLQQRLGGQQLSRLVLWIGGTGTGKSSVVRDLYVDLGYRKGVSCCIMSLEDTVQETILAMSSVIAGVRLVDPSVRESLTDKELLKYIDKLSSNIPYLFLTHNGGITCTELVTKIRYAHHQGCVHFLIDNLSLLTADSTEQDVSDIMKPLFELTNELNIRIDLVAHLRKRQESMRSYEAGAVPTLDSVAGFGAIKQLVDEVIAISRDSTSPDKSIRDVKCLHVIKARGLGDTGSCDYLMFDMDTGTHTVVDEPEPCDTSILGMM